VTSGLAGERLGQGPRQPRLIDVLGGVARQDALADEVTVEAAERRHPSRDGGRLASGPALTLHPRDDVLGAGRRRRHAPPGEQVEEVLEVAAVGVERVAGDVALGAQHGEELLERLRRIHHACGALPGDQRRGAPSSRAMTVRWI
jgi:hypothetical protein